MEDGKHKEVKILDCTLRDGGYCNNWQFDKKSAFEVIRALNNAGVDIIEVGYKTPNTHNSKSFEGLFKFCTESQLRFLEEYSSVEYAVMVDAKEFLTESHVDYSAVMDCFPACDQSLFNWVRVATHNTNLQGAIELVDVIHDLGYKVTLNLMGISLLSEENLQKAFSLAATADIDVLYFSDSFGDQNPNDIIHCINSLRSHYKGKIGIHSHDNNGLAFANSITAISAGIDYVDSTIMGMGRGAGNLKTEQILLFLYFKLKKLSVNPDELLDIIDSIFIPLHIKYKWGWDYSYMLSALQNIHPTYCQLLRATNQYTIGQVSEILNCIEPTQREKYSDEALLSAIDSVVNLPIQMNEKLTELPNYEPIVDDTFLVIATGPSVTDYQHELVTFINQIQPVVIECNPKNSIFEITSKKYFKSILNWVRLKKALDDPKISCAPIITGLAEIPEKYNNCQNILSVPCHISKNNVSLNKAKITLPAYVVGMFGIGLALLSEPKIVYLAGFDGYQDINDPKHEEMNMFWKEVSHNPLISITPTKYPITVKPIYKFIK